VARADDAERDFAPVGDENLLYHFRFGILDFGFAGSLETNPKSKIANLKLIRRDQ
jgi:hypothetical protein